MKLVMRNRECDTARLVSLLLSAGYRLQLGDVPPPNLLHIHLFYNVRRTVRVSHAASDDLELSEVFRSHQQTVPTLSHFCQQCIRRAVSSRGGHFVDNIHKLPLPILLQDFVALTGEFSLDPH